MAGSEPEERTAPVSPASVELPHGGTVHAVVRWGTDVMHRPARPVTAYDEELRTLVADMVATMYAADGVGLAACQIGVDRAVFVYDCPDESGTLHRGIVCNPVVELPEGARPDWARVRGQGLDGEDVVYEGDGLLARCLQHETDHTQGTVFGDRLNDRARKKLRKQMEAAAEDYPRDWPVGAGSARRSASGPGGTAIDVDHVDL
jgi:peptide deformylase